MPSTHLIITDLPVPDPPITTSEFGRADLEIDAVEHDLVAEALLDAAKLDLGCALQPFQLPNRREVRK